METVTISPKYQVVIPKSVREHLKLTPGQEVHVLAYRDRIEFIPVKPPGDYLGILKDLGVTYAREKSDRL